MAPSFFIPAAADDEQAEHVYVQMAETCGRDAPIQHERVYSTTFIHDGDEWTATVGQELRGKRVRTVTRGGRKVERTTRLSDAATVLAIFPGSPYMVFTNAGLAAGLRSAWVNPFLAGQPTAVTRFSP